jgi:hypothetical protein
MRQRALLVLAAFIGLSSNAYAGEKSGLLRSASCPVIRYYVAKYSEAAAEAWARSKGATDAEIEAARRCLSPDATATAQTQSRPLALGSYGW